MNLWRCAGRLVGIKPVLVARHGRSRPPRRDEAAAMLEAAIAALDAAGIPVRVVNHPDGYAIVLIRGGKWRAKYEEGLDNLEPTSLTHDVERLQLGRLRPHARVDAHGDR